MDTEIIKQLQMPFKPEEIEWRVGSTNSDKTKGLALAYVTNRAIQNRLDEVFGPFGWQNEFKEWKKESQICGISVWDEEKKQWITKWDGADDSATEAVKGGLSDSMKRAAYQWGIGRYLYNLPDTWIPLKNGKYLAYEPKLPSWALPEGYEYSNQEQSHEPPGNNEEHKNLSEAQVKRLFAIAGKKGYNAESVKKVALKKYNVTEISALTKQQYDEFVSGYEGLPDKTDYSGTPFEK